jgi:hypothetical protein
MGVSIREVSVYDCMAEDHLENSNGEFFGPLELLFLETCYTGCTWKVFSWLANRLLTFRFDPRYWLRLCSFYPF